MTMRKYVCKINTKILNSRVLELMLAHPIAQSETHQCCFVVGLGMAIVPTQACSIQTENPATNKYAMDSIYSMIIAALVSNGCQTHYLKLLLTSSQQN